MSLGMPGEEAEADSTMPEKVAKRVSIHLLWELRLATQYYVQHNLSIQISFIWPKYLRPTPTVFSGINSFAQPYNFNIH